MVSCGASQFANYPKYQKCFSTLPPMNWSVKFFPTGARSARQLAVCRWTARKGRYQVPSLSEEMFLNGGAL